MGGESALFMQSIALEQLRNSLHLYIRCCELGRYQLSQPLRAAVLQMVMEAMAAEQPILVDDDGVVDSTTVLDSDSEVIAMIKELLEARIRPAVQEDGGDIFFVSFDEDSGLVRLRMAGSCVGCPSSTATLH